MKKIKNNSIFKTLAELCYNKAIREDIEKRITAKYEKRIDYLVGANNELMKELEQYESEIVTVEKV
jgi:demethoxyubiquinone hydroxylase (CLK1/Coq7/Cat5 family)